MYRSRPVSLTLVALAVGCSSDSPTEPVAFEATVRVTGNVVSMDCSPAVGVRVVLDEFYCDSSRTLEPFDLGCGRTIHGTDQTDAEGWYEIEASVTCPRYLTVGVRVDGTGAIADLSEVECRGDDQQIDLVIGPEDAVCNPDS